MLLVSSLIVVGLLVLAASLWVLYQGRSHEQIRTVANIVSAGAAVTIPIVVADAAASSNFSVFKAAELSRLSEVNIAKDTRTLQMMIDLDQKIAALLLKKIPIDESRRPQREAKAALEPDPKTKADILSIYSFEYIDKSPDVLPLVRAILNEYEAVCVGVNQGLLSIPVVWTMRGDALLATFKDYGPYISEHRKRGNPNAWTDCVDLAKALDKQRDTINQAAEKTKKRILGQLQ